MLLSAIALAVTIPRGFPPMGRRIAEWCAAHQPRQRATCEATQREALRRYLGNMALFSDPGGRTAEQCMRQGKIKPSVDWRIALSCMRKANAGRPKWK